MFETVTKISPAARKRYCTTQFCVVKSIVLPRSYAYNKSKYKSAVLVKTVSQRGKRPEKGGSSLTHSLFLPVAQNSSGKVLSSCWRINVPKQWHSFLLLKL